MQKRKLTQEDIDLNPELAEQGLKAGDEIEIPEETTDNEETAVEPAGDGDTGGSNPPGNKPRP